MADNKKTKIYFWLKLDENFYKNIIIKKARKTNDTIGHCLPKVDVAVFSDKWLLIL